MLEGKNSRWRTAGVVHSLQSAHSFWTLTGASQRGHQVEERTKFGWAFCKRRGTPTVTRNMKSVLNFGVAAAVLLSAAVAWAGITGSISGTVTDPSGAVMPGVTVTVTSISTNVQSTTVTDVKGFYRFPALNVDLYNLALNQAGFQNFLESGIEINANSAISIDIKLEVGKVTNTITVKSDTLQVETQSTQMGDVIEGS